MLWPTAFGRYHGLSWNGGAKFQRGSKSPSFKRFFRMNVTDDKEGRTETSSFRLQNADVLIHRATRRSLACLYEENVKELRMCFLKDSWQEKSQPTASEADI